MSGRRKSKQNKHSQSDLQDGDAPRATKKGRRSSNDYLSEALELKKTIPNWDSFFSEAADDSRAEQWVRLSIIGASLSDRYSWAIPDSRALSILQNFAPLIEIGAGKGYWGDLLKKKGIDIICFDKLVPESPWTEILLGGPEKLKQKKKCEQKPVSMLS